MAAKGREFAFSIPPQILAGQYATCLSADSMHFEGPVMTEENFYQHHACWEPAADTGAAGLL
jgi:hypothetical protein